MRCLAIGAKCICAFVLLTVSHAVVPDATVAPVGSQTTPTQPPAQETEPCAWLVFIDDLHLNFKDTGELKNLLKTVFQLVQEGDLVAVVSTGPSSIAVDLTRDRGRLAAAVDKFAGAGLKPSEIVAEPASSSENRYRAHIAFSTAYDVMKMLASVRASHQAIIYISNGYYFDVWASGVRMGAVNPFTLQPKEFSLEHLRDEVAELTAQASRANLPIYAIDPRALSGPITRDPNLDDVTWQRYVTTTRNSLRVIAEQTGGFLIEDELESGLKRIATASGR